MPITAPIMLSFTPSNKDQTQKIVPLSAESHTYANSRVR